MRITAVGVFGRTRRTVRKREARELKKRQYRLVSSAEGMQAQEADGSRGPGQSDAFPHPESCGTFLWGASETRGEVDRAGHWSGQGESQGWVEESGLQFGSILCVGLGMSAPGISAGQNNPARH